MPVKIAPAYIGCAGWSLRKELASRFSTEGTHLERYARVFNAVEINSSFYRPHKKTTYGRWHGSVPAGFRFSVKAPKQATHVQRLGNTEEVMGRFLEEVSGLAELSKQVFRETRLGRPTWVVFDNTAEGHATTDALALIERAASLWTAPRERLRSPRIYSRQSRPINAPHRVKSRKMEDELSDTSAFRA